VLRRRHRRRRRYGSHGDFPGGAQCRPPWAPKQGSHVRGNPKSPKGMFNLRLCVILACGSDRLVDFLTLFSRILRVAN
jgi:hypothetical protein